MDLFIQVVYCVFHSLLSMFMDRQSGDGTQCYNSFSCITCVLICFAVVLRRFVLSNRVLRFFCLHYCVGIGRNATNAQLLFCNLLRQFGCLRIAIL